MKTLSLEEMEEVTGGGCSESANQFITTAGFIAGIGACFGPVGLAICGPTALGMGIAGMVCAYN